MTAAMAISGTRQSGRGLTSSSVEVRDVARDFTVYVEARQRMLVGFAHLVCGDRDLAEDLVQEALARAYPHWARVGADGFDTDAYVRRSIVNAHNSLWRRAFMRRERLADRLPERGHEDEHPDDTTWTLVLALPPRQRQVVALRFYADLSVAETAAVMKCSEGTVKSQTSHALAALRAHLGGDLDRQGA